MFNNLKLILIGAAAAALFGGGYLFGHHEVDTLKAQIKEIKGEGDYADAKRKAVQVEIDKVLKSKEAEYTRQVEILKADADRRAKELSTALAGAKNTIAALQAQVSANTARRAKLVAAMATAPEAERKKLQEQIDALDREKSNLITQLDANQCMAFAVPEAAIGPLVQRK